ncbi:MAG: type IV secretory system conjugative DNA transfer family protein [Bacilli bacterium]|nr:type IV secretory system conjugative DNA transfer family protein [Bacilli bacterium]
MSYARWATKDEVVEKLKGVNLETGVEVSGTPITYDDKYLYIDTREAHNLIIGSTGSGKTQSMILPMLKLAMMAGESIVVNDPKGELYSKCAKALKEKGYEVCVLDFEDAKYGNSWNPLKMPYELYHAGEKDKAIKCLEDVAYYLFYERTEANADPFWINSVIDYFTGISLYLIENAKEEEVHLESIASLSYQVNSKGNCEKFMEKISPSSKIYLNLVGTLKAPPETRGSILAVFNQKIKKYISRENLSNMLSNSDFDLDGLSKKPSALFIISGVSNYCNNLIPLLVNQIVDYVNFYGKSEKNFHVLLDEFDSMVPIRDFSRMIENCRSIKIKITVTIRSYVHLCSMYSKEEAEILKMCFGNLIYLLSDDIYTLQEVSKYCGMQMVDHELVPLVTIEDLKMIGTFEGIVIMPRTMPFKTKFLPDYKIDWGMDFLETSIPERVIKPLVLFNEKDN